MTDLIFKCSACGQHLRSDEQQTGAKATCPSCQKLIAVPSAIGEVFCPICRQAIKVTTTALGETFRCPKCEKAFQVPQKPFPVSTPPPVSSGFVVCPYCWRRFNLEDFLFVASHEDHRGDNVLGADEMQRFLPSSFTTDGHAKDSKGRVCTDRACPHCHFIIPRSLVALRPLFLSMVGASGSGKSYLLASMCWKLRTTLPGCFQIRFTDADTELNSWLNSYEKLLFVQADGSKYQYLQKTQVVSDRRHYREVKLDGMDELLAIPSMFNLQAHDASLFHQQLKDPINRTMIVYDNAGEQFLPKGEASSPLGTKHLLHSEALLFLFDPTMDINFRSTLADVSDIQLKLEHNVDRQDLYFTTTVNRIRKNLGIDPTESYRKPVIVLLSKADVLGEEIGEYLNKNPWRWDEEIEAHVLDYSYLLQVSFVVRSLLQARAREVVEAVEAFAEDVVYLPVSAIGHSPTLDEKSGQLHIRPCDVVPKWVEVPFLHILFKLGYISAVMDRDKSHPIPESCRVRGGMFHFVIPGTTERVTLPVCYAGVSLPCPGKTGKWFRLPDMK